MKTKIFIISLFISLLFFRPVLAHGDEPRLEISQEKLSPGGVIEVRGVDFEVEEVIALSLVGSGSEIQLGEMTADLEGVFLQIITLPADLSEGTYQFRAVTDDHEITSPAILVQGAPISNEENEGQRSEDEPLLVAMPAVDPGVVATLPAPSTSPVETRADKNQNVMVLSILGVVGILLVIGVVRMKR